MNEKQYVAFASNVKTMDSLRNSEVHYVPGVFEVKKVIVLSKEDFTKLSEDISPAYPFLQDHRELMSAAPGGLFQCLLVRAEGERENLLFAQGGDRLFIAYGRDYRHVNLQGVPVERIILEEPRAYQEYAVFYHRPRHVGEISGPNPRRSVPERQTSFRVEQVVVLTDERYRRFKETDLPDDQSFLSEHSDKMWFDPGGLCWHCLLVKGETSKDGLLVETEGHAYARYAAFAPNCEKLWLQDVPVHYEPPAKAPRQRNTHRQEGARGRGGPRRGDRER